MTGANPVMRILAGVVGLAFVVFPVVAKEPFLEWLIWPQHRAE